MPIMLTNFTGKCPRAYRFIILHIFYINTPFVFTMVFYTIFNINKKELL